MGHTSLMAGDYNSGFHTASILKLSFPAQEVDVAESQEFSSSKGSLPSSTHVDDPESCPRSLKSSVSMARIGGLLPFGIGNSNVVKHSSPTQYHRRPFEEGPSISKTTSKQGPTAATPKLRTPSQPQSAAFVELYNRRVASTNPNRIGQSHPQDDIALRSETSVSDDEALNTVRAVEQAKQRLSPSPSFWRRPSSWGRSSTGNTNDLAGFDSPSSGEILITTDIVVSSPHHCQKGSLRLPRLGGLIKRTHGTHRKRKGNEDELDNDVCAHGVSEDRESGVDGVTGSFLDLDGDDEGEESGDDQEGKDSSEAGDEEEEGDEGFIAYAKEATFRRPVIVDYGSTVPIGIAAMLVPGPSSTDAASGQPASQQGATNPKKQDTKDGLGPEEGDVGSTNPRHTRFEAASSQAAEDWHNHGNTKWPLKKSVTFPLPPALDLSLGNRSFKEEVVSTPYPYGYDGTANANGDEDETSLEGGDQDERSVLCDDIGTAC